MEKEDLKVAGVLDNKYILIRKVGSGGTSSVYIGYLKPDDINERPLNQTNETILQNTKFAIKIINPKKQDAKCFHTEVKMLKSIDHPNVVKIIEGGEGNMIKTDGRSKYVNYIVLEYIENGELFDFIFFVGKGFGEAYGRLIFISILNGLEACHSAGVVHRDLKTENIMVTEDFNVKIADFGFAALKSGSNGQGLLYTSLGTPNYAAPELHLKSAYYGECNDIFALAVTLFVLVTGAMPFKQATSFDAFYSHVIKNDYEGYWTKRGLKIKLSEKLKSLFFSLIAFDYSTRPSIEEIRNHPWVTDEAIDENNNNYNNNKLDKLNELHKMNELKIEFAKRKEIVDGKRMKEKIQREQEKNENRVTNYGYGNRVYKSGDNFNFVYEKKNERPLEKYFDYGNRFIVIINNGNGNYERDNNISRNRNKNNNINIEPKFLMKTIQKFFESKKGFVIKHSEEKWCIKVELPYLLNEEEELDTTTENTSESAVVFLQNIKMQIEIKKYEDDKLIVEFNKCSGDKFTFYKHYEDFISFVTVTPVTE